VRAVLNDTSVTRLVVEQRDRLTRCGCHDLQAPLAAHARQMEGGIRAENDQAENDQAKVVADWVPDLVALVSSCTARLYRRRRAAGKAQDGTDRR
jgi:putative resolvase